MDALRCIGIVIDLFDEFDSQISIDSLSIPQLIMIKPKWFRFPLFRCFFAASFRFAFLFTLLKLSCSESLQRTTGAFMRARHSCKIWNWRMATLRCVQAVDICARRQLYCLLALFPGQIHPGCWECHMHFVSNSCRRNFCIDADKKFTSVRGVWVLLSYSGISSVTWLS